MEILNTIKSFIATGGINLLFSAICAIVLEPTGSAVRMYSSMTAASIFFLRLLMSIISSAGTRSCRLLALLTFEC